jgi:hypothetical protein
VELDGAEGFDGGRKRKHANFVVICVFPLLAFLAQRQRLPGPDKGVWEIRVAMFQSPVHRLVG